MRNCEQLTIRIDPDFPIPVNIRSLLQLFVSLESLVLFSVLILRFRRMNEEL